MSIAALIRAMSDAGAPAEAIALAVEAIEASQAKDADRRARAAEKKARQRAGKAGQSPDSPGTVPGHDRDNLPPKEKSPTPPKEITPITVSEPRGSSTESAREFASFWSLYPNKVGKPAAQASFVKARKRAAFDAIMAGLRRYVEKTDDRAWCNPKTWLNQERWDDQPATPTPRATAPPGRRPNAVEAVASLRARERQHEPLGPIIDHGDAERFRPDEPKLRGLVADLGQALRWDGGSSRN